MKKRKVRVVWMRSEDEKSTLSKQRLILSMLSDLMLQQMFIYYAKILSITYALPQILATYCGDQVQDLMQLTSWRKENQVTAGRVRLGLQMILSNVRIRDWWNSKHQIFRSPIEAKPPPDNENMMKSHDGFMSKNNLIKIHPPLS
jgi:hypothetical protein